MQTRKLGSLEVSALGSGAMSISANYGPPADRAQGYYTMVDQALDLGLLVPLSIAVGVLLLRRETLGYLLSASTLMLGLTVGLSVVAGEVMLGLSTGQMNLGGIAVFTAFLVVGGVLLASVLVRVRSTTASA